MQKPALHDSRAILFLPAIGVRETIFIAGFQAQETGVPGQVKLVFGTYADHSGKVNGSHIGLGQFHVIPRIGIVRVFLFQSNFPLGGKAQHRRDKHIRTECRIGLAELVHDRHPDVPITRLQGITHVLIKAAVIHTLFYFYFRQFSSTAQKRELRTDGKMQIFSEIIFCENGKHSAIQELVRREDLLIDVGELHFTGVEASPDTKIPLPFLP